MVVGTFPVTPGGLGSIRVAAIELFQHVLRWRNNQRRSCEAGQNDPGHVTPYRLCKLYIKICCTHALFQESDSTEEGTK